MSISISGNGTFTGVSTSYSFDQNVSIGGTLTYEDVTNIDSVGVITARSGIHVTGGDITLNKSRSVTHASLIIDKPDDGSGTLKFYNNGSDSGYIQHTNAEHLHYYLPSGSGYHAFYTNGNNERLRITSGGRVGLGSDGVSSPQSVLHVFSNSSTDTIKIQAPTSSGDYNAGFEVLRDTTAGGAKMVAKRNTVSGGVGWEWFTTANNTAEVNATYTSRMILTESGDLGIGTASPTADGLHIVNSTQPDIFMGTSTNAEGFKVVYNDTDTVIGNVTSTPLRFVIGNDEKARIDSDGNMGLGTINPGEKVEILEANAGGSVTLKISNTGDSNIDTACTILARQGPRQGGQIVFGRENADSWTAAAASADGYISFRPVLSGSNVEAMRITSGQSVRIGQFGSSQPASDDVRGCAIDATGFISACNTGGRAIEIGRTENDAVSREVLRWFRNGSLVQTITTTATTVSYPTGSDYRLKENVVDMTGAIDRVKQLSPKRFNFIVEPGVEKDGFIAHELETVVPQAVVGEKDQVDEDGNPVWQGVDHSFMVPLLTGALQEAIAKIETLEQRLSDAGIA